jgi:hypothetical protein
MYNREMTMDVSGNSHNPGDVLYINDERWMVTRVHSNWTHSKVYCEPLADVLARNTIISVDGYERITIADYIKIICDEYEYDCQG